MVKTGMQLTSIGKGLAMKKLLTGAVAAVAIAGTSSAFAADIPMKAPPRAPIVAPVVYSWTGCYIGGNVGGAWRGGDGWRDDRFALNWGTVTTTVGLSSAVRLGATISSIVL